MTNDQWLFSFCLIFKDTEADGLCCTDAYEKPSLMHYMAVYASSLLENLTKDFLGLMIPSDVSVMCQSDSVH